ncbi:hypothetical protein ZOSMA_240G00220 [Zostera marina]|uniref:Nucleoporin Nup133/Nup155-like N-terminal domain-containing protein n=1 Tax=Zostera marina TaxID=29655 RepID=A0A0K9PH87_ZOSMR|nr:hypothetical protein ZOSMA_240G00220 [Zostera marina]
MDTPHLLEEAIIWYGRTRFLVQTWLPLVSMFSDYICRAGGEGTALCGIFPEIRRAWASVDNSLFLWRFDKWSFYGSVCSII